MNTKNRPGHQHECLAVPFSAGAALREIHPARRSPHGTVAIGHALGVG